MTFTTAPSLLLRLRDRADSRAWQRLTALYTPLLHDSLHRYGVPPADADDLVQEVLQAVAREMPRFEYDPARGSFRGWLRTILVNRLRYYRRSRNARPEAGGDGFYDRLLDQLTDEGSDLSRFWDREHDQHVVARLLELVRGEFEARTWEAFRLVTLEGLGTREAAENLHLSPNAVRLAKSRILSRLRQEAEGLID
jgi:RNA polymerase sigma-70 factor (ECF subfamily)